MPIMLGQFESSLRVASSPGHGDPNEKKVMHKGCSGASHGHGVKKEKSVRDERERETDWLAGSPRMRSSCSTEQLNIYRAPFPFAIDLAPFL